MSLTNEMISDVLNLRIADLAKWEWKQDDLVFEERRNINGKYDIHAREDLLQAIFLQYLGISWSVEFKGKAKIFCDSAWKRLPVTIDKKERLRREHFLGETVDDKASVQHKRFEIFAKKFYFPILL